MSHMYGGPHDDSLSPAERRKLFWFILTAALVLAAIGIALVTFVHQGGHFGPDTSPAMPACETGASLDFNDGSMPLCYTVTVDGSVVVIDATDTVVSVSAS
jgi:hypothetical protein